MNNEQDSREIYAALESLCGDLYLLGMCEIKLEDIYAGSQQDALKVLKKHQHLRSDDLQQCAIATKPKAAAPNTQEAKTTASVATD